MKDEAGLSAELLGCPFCGGPGHVDHGGPHEPDEWCGLCIACDYSLPFERSREAAVIAWNTRSSGQKPFDDGVREKVARIVANAIFQSGYTGQPTVNGPCKDAASTIIALLDPPHDH